MAFDKVVDSAVLDAGLKAIADAIRAKAGTSGNMAFPTAMAEAIAAIEAGGGGGGRVASGMITPSADITFDGETPFAIEHGLGQKPDFVAFTSDATTTSTYQIVAGMYIASGWNYHSMETGILVGSGRYATTGVTLPTNAKNIGRSGYLACNADENNILLIGESGSYKLMGGRRFAWIAGCLT